MSLKQQITDDLKAAMLNKEVFTRDVLRVLKGEIARDEDASKQLSDEDIVKTVKKSIKNLETIGTDESKAEIEILQKYLPQQMSEDQIRVAVTQIIEETGASEKKQMGMVMGAFNKKYAGQADGKIVSGIVRSILV